MEEVRTFVAKNGETITLRPAVPEDATEIIKTVSSTSLNRSYILMDKYGKDEEAEKKYITEIDRGHNLLLVAVSNDVVIGSLAALQAEGGQNLQTAHVINIGLHLIKTFREAGIGTHMLKYAIEWAREKGFKKLEASIFTTNKGSLTLFSHAGFCEEGTRRKQFRIGSEYIDEVFMGKILE